MNIKHAPCLARVIGPKSPWHQWIVKVHYPSKRGWVTNPDGELVRDTKSKKGDWLVESLMASPFKVDGVTRRFCVCPDAHLRPLPGLDEPTTEDVPEGIAA